MNHSKEVQRCLKVKRLRFYLQSTYKKPFHVEHTKGHLCIEWNGLPHTDEVKQCVDDSEGFKKVKKINLIQHHPRFPDEYFMSVEDTYDYSKKQHKLLWLLPRSLEVLYDGCRHVLIGVVVFTLHAWFVD